MLKSIYAAILVAATLAIPAVVPQEAEAQFYYRGPRVGVAVGRPYWGGYGYGYNSYYSYPSYGYGYNSYYSPGYYNYGYGPRAYRYWR